MRRGFSTIALTWALACIASYQIACAEQDSVGLEGANTTGEQTDVATNQHMPCIEGREMCAEKQQGCRQDPTTFEETCFPCAEMEMPDESGACVRIDGTMLEHDFGSLTIEGGGEYNGVCQSWILNNPEELWVNAVEFSSQGFYHHSNWFFVPEGNHDYKDGNWYDCYNDGFEEITAALKGGVLFAQSTQVNREVQRFGKGVALRIPPYSRIIAATHLLNYTPNEVTTRLIMRLYTLDKGELEVKLTPFRLGYYPLDIPPNATSEFRTECNIDDAFLSADDKNLDMKVHYVLPHYHSLGADFRLGIHGGERDNETLFSLGAFGGDPFGKVFDPPVDLTGAKGLEFSCTFSNPRDEAVGWGIGDQEMCLMLGFAESTVAFDGSVQETTLLGPDENGIVQHAGPCNVTGFKFSQNKSGGIPNDTL